jgi:hypothetical protein
MTHIGAARNVGLFVLFIASLALIGCAPGRGRDGICSCCCQEAGVCSQRGIAQASGRSCDAACQTWCAGRGCAYDDEPGACDQDLEPLVHDVWLSCPDDGCLPDYTYDLTFSTENAVEWTSLLEVTIGDGTPGTLTPDSGDGGEAVEGRYRAGDGSGDSIVITIEARNASGVVGYGSAVATIH